MIGTSAAHIQAANELLTLAQVLRSPDELVAQLTELRDLLASVSAANEENGRQMFALRLGKDALDERAQDIEAKEAKLRERIEAAENYAAKLREQSAALNARERDINEREAKYRADLAGFEQYVKDQETAIAMKADAAAVAQNNADTLIAEYEGKLEQLKSITG